MVSGTRRRSARAVVGGREFVLLMATCMGMAAMSIDLMLPAFPEMRAQFGLAEDSTEVSRLLTAFFLGLAAGQLFYGPLSDRFGRRRLLRIGLGIYIVSALAASAASSLGAVVLCRFAWGIGAGAPRSLALAMVRDTHEGDHMARTMSHIMATFILVPVFAPTIGAGFMEFLPWRVVFWLPAAAAVALLLWTTRLDETLAEADRRSVAPRALLDALVAVGRSRQTVAFGLAAMSLFGIMSAYIGSSEIIFDDVFGEADRFPLLFGLLACAIGVGALISGRLVMRLGLAKLVRNGAAYLVGASVGLALLTLATDGRPHLLAFLVVMVLVLPGVTMLVPNCNTAAMAPLPHVAGMAAAVLGTVGTAGGALLGAIVDSSFDGTVAPFAYGVLVYASMAAFAILVLARTPRPVPAVDAVLGAASAVSVGDVAAPGEVATSSPS